MASLELGGSKLSMACVLSGSIMLETMLILRGGGESVLKLIYTFMPIYLYSFKLGIHYIREPLTNHNNNHMNQHKPHIMSNTHITQRFNVETLPGEKPLYLVYYLM